MAASKAFTLVVLVGGSVEATKKVTTWDDAKEVFAIVRSHLRALAEKDRCGGVLLALHPCSEACDHEYDQGGT